MLRTIFKKKEITNQERSDFTNKYLINDANAENPAEVVVIANRKGGVGKSTTAKNLVNDLQPYVQVNGLKPILVVDLDGQCNFSSWCGIGSSKIDITSCISGEVSLIDAVIETSRVNVMIIPGSKYIENSIIHFNKPETPKEQVTVLANQINEIRNQFSFIIIDTSPFFNLITANALASSTLVIIPTKTDPDSVQGALETVNEISDIGRIIQRPLSFKVLITMKNRNNISNETLNEFREHFKKNIFNTVIRFQENPVVLSSQKNLGISELFPREKIALEYQALAEEIVRKS